MRAVAATLLPLACASILTAQPAVPPQPAGIIAGNAAIGAATAAVRALVDHRAVGRALFQGGLGGLVLGSGKVLAPRHWWPGFAISTVGTSMVANAAAGSGLLDQLMLPAGPVRARFDVRERRMRAGINAFETITLARHLALPDTRIDWKLSLQSSALVLHTARPITKTAVGRAAGRTSGSVVLLSDHARRPERTLPHERVHLQQGWYSGEVIGRPIELSLRTHSFLSWIPSWIEIGGFPAALLAVERHAIGPNGPIRSWHEAEAEAIELLAVP